MSSTTLQRHAPWPGSVEPGWWHTGVTSTTPPTVVFGSAPLVSDCSTATAHVQVPADLTPGVYEVWAVHTDGTRYSSVECTADGPYDTGTAVCRPIVISVGGAR